MAKIIWGKNWACLPCCYQLKIRAAIESHTTVSRLAREVWLMAVESGSLSVLAQICSAAPKAK